MNNHIKFELRALRCGAEHHDDKIVVPLQLAGENCKKFPRIGVEKDWTVKARIVLVYLPDIVSYLVPVGVS